LNSLIGEVDHTRSDRVLGEAGRAAQRALDDETLIGTLDRRNEPRVGVRGTPNAAQNVDERDEHGRS
jgi:hypothetical protein